MNCEHFAKFKIGVPLCVLWEKFYKKILYANKFEKGNKIKKNSVV